ncbi:hypothetical protein KIPB_015487, partial [Kipferlia bialata]
VIASIQRVFFPTELVRKQFIAVHLERTVGIMKSGCGLNDAENLHEFCWLLFRIRRKEPLMRQVSSFMDSMELSEASDTDPHESSDEINMSEIR